MEDLTIEAVGATQLVLQPGDSVKTNGTTYLIVNPAQVEATEKPKAEKQETYLLKASCPSCGYTVRVTKKWLKKPRAEELESGLLCMECNVLLKETE